MRPIDLVAADQLSTPQLVEAFNHTFEGYSLPIAHTVDSLLAMIEADDIQLQDSLVARAYGDEVRAHVHQDEFQVVERIPTVEEYLALREAVGWGRLSEEMAARGLANALFTV